MTVPCVVERPGMRPYRARLAPTAEYWTEDDDRVPVHGVTVYRTHDPAQSDPLAHTEMRAHGEPGDTLSAGERVWLRKTWGTAGPTWERAEPTQHGAIPCMVYRIEEA